MLETPRLGRCLNTGRCGLSGQRGPIPIVPPAPFLCPECKSELVDFGPPAKKVDAGKKLPPVRKMLLLPGLLLAILVVIGIRFNLFGALDIADIPPVSLGSAEAFNPPSSVRTGTSLVTYDELAPNLWRGFLSEQGCTDVDRRVTDGKTSIGCKAGEAPAISIFAPTSKIGMAGTAMKTFDVLITTADGFADLPPGSQVAKPGDDGSVVHGDVIGIDALVVIVNPGNPLARLSQPQLAGIFLGTIRDYAGVGGRAGAIKVIAPAASTLANDRLDAIVPQWLPLAPTAKRLKSWDDIAAAVIADPAAIGIAPLRYAGKARVLAIGPIAGAATAPTPVGLVSGDYPLARPVRAVRFNRDDSPYETGFVTFAQSPAGRSIIIAAGFEPVRTDHFPQKLPADTPAAYRALVGGAHRIAANIRFRGTSLDLQTRSRADLDAVAARLAGERIAADRIIVIGFADPRAPNPAADSDSIARQIATLLGERGIDSPQSHGLGAIMPIAEPAESQRNRRVELWIKPAAASTTPP